MPIEFFEEPDVEELISKPAKELAEYWKQLRLEKEGLEAEVAVLNEKIETVSNILSSKMDEEGITRMTTVDNHKVGTKRYFNVSVKSIKDFEVWCHENGVYDEYITPSVRKGSKGEPGVTELVKLAVKENTPIPPGLTFNQGTHLVLYKPKEEMMFTNAGTSLIEMLKQQKGE